MKIEVGKCYRTAGGEKAEVTEPRGQLFRANVGRRKLFYDASGVAPHMGEKFDLIAEWTDPAPAAPDYNDGNWRAWTGGDCPVHPQSVVELQRPNCRATEYTAAEVVWGKGPLLFRVTKPHQPPKVPRQVWCDDGDCFWDTREEAMRFSPSGKPRLFREVLE